MMQVYARDLAKTLDLPRFKASIGYIQRFCMRNNLTYRRPTHQAQETNQTARDQCALALEFLADVYDHLLDGNFEYFVNLDETPIYIDPTITRTIDEVGTRTVDVVNSGHTKSRMTLLLTIASDGSMAPAYLLFKGLKKAPQCDYPATIIPNASSSGTMDEYLFIDFIEKVLVPTYSNKRMLLLLDQCRSHMTDLVRAKLRYHNIQPIYIPGKYFFTQKSTFPIVLIVYVF